MSLKEVKLSPWQLDQNNPTAITKSSVEGQDELSVEDFLDNPELGSDMNGWSALTTAGMQFLSQTYIGQAYNYGRGELGKYFEEPSKRPTGTVDQNYDTLGVEFKNVKNSKYKNVKLSSKLGQYNSMMNMLGTASGAFVGTLGKSLAGNVVDDALSQCLQSLPFGSLASNAATIIEKTVRGTVSTKKDGTTISSITPHADDLLALTAANYYTILSYKPGLRIRSYGDRLEYVTGKNSGLRLETDKEKTQRIRNSNRSKADRELIVAADRNNYATQISKNGVINNRYYEYVTESRNNDDNYTPSNKKEIGVDDASKITTTIKRPDNLIEYTTGLFSTEDPLKDNTRGTQKIITEPNKENLELRVNNSVEDLLEQKSFKTVEYVTNENSIFASGDTSVGLISVDDLNAYINNYKYFGIEKDVNEGEIYTTNTILSGNGTLKPNINFTQIKEPTVINSILRKEIKIKAQNVIDGNINDYEMPLTDGSADYENGKFGRITKAQIFNRVNNKFREIGGLYIEPFYNGGQLQCFEIPFEFNPTISEGGAVANYTSEEVLGRILKIRSYISSDASTVTINAKYFVTSNNSNTSDGWLAGWMKDWTVDRLKIVENQYRSLTLPYIKDANFVRPPIVRIKMRGASAESGSRTIGDATDEAYGLTVGDLFRYPSVDDRMQITTHFDGKTRDKRYVVTNVNISPLDTNSFGNSYGYHELNERFSTIKRNGFEVSLTLVETTKNFLDLIPNYYEYTKDAQEEIPYSGGYDGYKFTPEQEPDLSSCLNQHLYFDTKIPILGWQKRGDGTGIDNGINGPWTVTVFSNRTFHVYEENTKKDAWFTYSKDCPKPNSELRQVVDEIIASANESRHNIVLFYDDKEVKISNKVDEDINPLYLPNSQIDKTWKNYSKELEEEGLSIEEIIELIKGTKWETVLEYQRWLWDNGNNFKEGWLKYYEIVKKFYTDIEIIKNIFSGFEHWKYDREFKEWLVGSKKFINAYYLANCSFEELINIAKDVDVGLATAVKNFKGTYYDTKDSKYINWITSKTGTGTYIDPNFSTFTPLYNSFERAGYSDDDIDFLMANGYWGNYSALLESDDKGYWDTFGNKLTILTRRMSLEDWIEIYKRRTNMSPLDNWIEGIIKTISDEKEILGKDDFVSEFRELLDMIYTSAKKQGNPYIFSLTDNTKRNIYKILKNNGYTDGNIRWILDNSEFADNDMDYKDWIINQKPKSEPIDYEDSYEGYKFFEEQPIKETIEGEKEDNSDLEFDMSDIYKNDWNEELTNANQMFVRFFKNSTEDNEYASPADKH